MLAAEILEANQGNYETLYAKEEAFLRYPADWLIRFHNMALRGKTGRALDYGCGSGNNSIFLMQKGYEVHGVDVAPSFKNLVAKNLDLHGLRHSHLDNFSMISPDAVSLPFPDGHFDFILSNQVLYYLPSEEHLRKVAAELNRVLAPGGIVFFTMVGPKNYYIAEHTVDVQGGVYDCQIRTPGHRLEGVRELILLIRDKEHCADVFDVFDPLTIGYFDQSMFDLTSNFHWIFAGTKR